MPNIETLNLDPRPVAVGPVDGEEAVVRVSGATTLPRGTILGKLSAGQDSTAGVVTGTGTRVTALRAAPGGTRKIGAYELVFGTLAAGAGPATLTDPDGESQTVTVTASGDQTFAELGVIVNIAASGTAFVTADEVAFNVVSVGRPIYVPFNPGGSDGAQNARAVLLTELVAGAAGDLIARPAIRGDVNLDLLSIVGGAPVSIAVVEALRLVGIFPWPVREHGVYDNPAPTP